MEDAKSKERKQPKNKIPLFSNLPLAFSSIFSNGVRANIQRAIPFGSPRPLPG
ncbi:MAG TPA: hypothetical protein VL095_09430 [Flavisolibacter sp.]|nr:hypothetical protein [Flavisolibacter sp.]